MERKKQIEVEEKEVSRKDKELVATVRRPAEAESYKVETIAQGKRLVRNYSELWVKAKLSKIFRLFEENTSISAILDSSYQYSTVFRYQSHARWWPSCLNATLFFHVKSYKVC